MAGGILARLKVLIGADVSQLNSGLNEAQVKTEKTSRKIEGSFKGLGATFARAIGPLSETGRQVSFALQGIGEAAGEANKAFAGLGASMSIFASIATGGVLALTGITLKLFQQIDEQADLAKGVGLTTGKYVELTSALKLYGVEQQQITPGLAQFFKIVSGLMRSKAGEEAIKQLGMSMKDLRLKDTHEQLLAVADAFSKFPDGPRKSAIAAQLFTATLGEKMIPLLDQGAAGVAKLEARYKDLGDESERLADTTKNLSIQFSQAFSDLSAQALKASGAAGIPSMLISIAHPLATTKALILDLGHVIAEVFEGAVSGVESLAKAFNQMPAAIVPHIPTAGLDEARRYFAELSAGFTQEAAKAAEPLFGSGETPLKGGGILPPGGTGGGAEMAKAAAYLKSLHQQVAEFGKGDVAKGLDRLKELGATQRQLAEGKGLLQQLDYLKAEQKFTEEFAKSTQAMEKTLGKLDLPKTKVDGLADSFSKLTDAIEASGAAAMGLKRGSEPQSPLAGIIGGPIGGNVPGFSPSGFGKMRFDMEKLGESARKMGETFNSSFVRMIEGGQSFGQMLGNLRNELELFIIKAVVFKEIASAFSSLGGWFGVVGKFFSGLAAPGRASGGPVEAGSLYKVGERGPEYFIPAVSGTIAPMAAAGGGGRGQMIFAPIYNINTPNPDAFRKSQAQILTDAHRTMRLVAARNL